MDFLIPFTSFCLGSFLVYFIFHIKFGSIKEYQRRILIDTEHLQERKIQESHFLLKEIELKQKADLRIEEETKRFKLKKLEEQLKTQQDDLQLKIKKAKDKEHQLNDKENHLKLLEKKVFEIAQMSEKEAKDFLLQSFEESARKDASLLVAKIEQEAQETSSIKARKILETAIQRIHLPSLNSMITAGVPIEDEGIKAKIVGREGRNIRIFEEATGTTLLMDESPHSIIISCFDPIRREIAIKSLKLLIADGKIHPTRIEEVVQSTKAKVDEIILQKGEEAALKAQVYSLHEELIKLLGKLHFRYSLGQNVLEHSIEVSHILGLVAEEMGMNGSLARRIGLLHDIGKAVEEQKGKSHALIGMELAAKWGEKDEISNGIGCHHFEVAPITLEGSLCNVADAISAAKPGARQERLEYYMRRMHDLESVAKEVAGVEKVYALQMGKEIRVVVHPDWNHDWELKEIARTVKEKVQSKNPTAGKVKLTLCCETKIIEMI